MSSDKEQDQGLDPTEEVGPNEAEPTPYEVEEKVGAADADASEAEYSWREEVDEAFKPRPIPMAASPQDGMPTPLGDETRLAIPPAFTRENVVCIEDDRQYVELFKSDLYARGWKVLRVELPPLPHSGAAAHAGDIKVRDQYDAEGKPQERKVFAPEQVQERWGVLWAITVRSWTPVRPVRERCKFYKQQLWMSDQHPDPLEPGHLMLFRNCTHPHRRSIGGACLSLRDEGIKACEYRDPPDLPSTKRFLDDPTKKRLEEEPEEIPLFNVG